MYLNYGDNFINNMIGSPRGSRSGSSGWSYEHLKVLTDDPVTAELYMFNHSKWSGA